jgi:hypothetical protein
MRLLQQTICTGSGQPPVNGSCSCNIPRQIPSQPPDHCCGAEVASTFGGTCCSGGCNLQTGCDPEFDGPQCAVNGACAINVCNYAMRQFRYRAAANLLGNAWRL